jgi:hypothetical protein
MSNAKHKRLDAAVQQTPRQQEPSVERAFDLWLERGLHQLYDDVASQPIPDALLALIEDTHEARKLDTGE